MFTFIQWLARNCSSLFVLCAGMALGVLICIPLLPHGWSLPDASANLLGGILGAVGSVGGAFCLIQYQEQRKNALALISIQTSCLELASACVMAFAGLKNSQPEVIRSGLEISIELIDRFIVRTGRYEDSLCLLSHRERQAHSLLEHLLYMYKKQADDFIPILKDATKKEPVPTQLSHNEMRSKINTHCKNMQNTIRLMHSKFAVLVPKIANSDTWPADAREA
ncbi:hypothetical protein ELE36_08815 [Pseudolysobacter antarcticus]|uniref:Uncharacterized protein n=1 Tax=Pseudolysobacter antarcticus TaxID=2511995 RepID=A0A411HIX8_9GAMM|nr:hypothetical protein [Pseudolysobacter antarcticus]QBB70458.1 hypothetical protein ELE36_08815 [Pseudolysobacter antarcticus]